MRRRIDLAGARYGMLTVISHAPNLHGRTAWNCVCDCGNKVVRTTDGLRTAKNKLPKSCGCMAYEDSAARLRAIRKDAAIDMTGRKFGKLTAISRSERRNSRGDIHWWCRCECGGLCERSGVYLRANVGREPPLGCNICGRLPRIKPGDVYGRWTVLGWFKDEGKTTHMLCHCACGTYKAIRVNTLAGGHSRSCGCAREEYIQSLRALPPEAYEINNSKRASKYLTDAYVRSTLRSKTLRSGDVPEFLIEPQRLVLKIKRYLKEIS